MFCIIGDGECDEGAIWESALIANQFKLDNLIVTIDFNKIQSITSVENTIRLEPLEAHTRAEVSTDAGVFAGRDHLITITATQAP